MPVTLDLDSARETFEASTDFTVGLEEEFAILDPRHARPRRRASRSCATRRRPTRCSRDVDRRRADLLGDRDPLRPRRGLRRRARAPARRAPAAVRPGRRRAASRSARPARIRGPTTASSRSSTPSTTAASTDGLQYVAWRNNTFSLHVHVGVRGADRAVRVCDRLRPVLPLLLAVSANSPFVDGRDRGLHSARTQIFTQELPALRRARRVRRLGRLSATTSSSSSRTSSIVEYTQVWWSVRPHFELRHRRGAHLRRAGAPPRSPRRWPALIVACVAQAARDDDEGVPLRGPAPRLIEENMWRAIRYGLDGRLIDLDRARGVPGARRPPSACSSGPRPSAPSSASSCPSPSSTAPSASAR